jgi:hypothetical protein
MSGLEQITLKRFLRRLTAQMNCAYACVAASPAIACLASPVFYVKRPVHIPEAKVIILVDYGTTLSLLIFLIEATY